MVTYFIIAIVILAVTELAFIFALLKLHDKEIDLEDKLQFIKSILEVEGGYVNKIDATTLRWAENMDNMVKLTSTNNELCERIYDSYKNICDAYDVIKSHYGRLIDTWKEIDNRYDDTCDQFKLCTEELKSFKKVMEPWCIDSDQLGDRFVKNNDPDSQDYVWDG